MENNPAYVKWIWMSKDGSDKLVHPGNVENHLRAGWTLTPVAMETPIQTEQDPSATVADEPMPVETPKRKKSKKGITGPSLP